MSYAASYPGIAASTGTRVDDAKHKMACRVNDALMACWCSDQQDARTQLHAQKFKYAVHKDDLALNVGSPLTSSSLVPHPIKAYPSIVSTLGDMTESTKNLIKYMYHCSRAGEDFFNFQRVIETLHQTANKDKVITNGDAPTRVSHEIQSLPYFQAQGYSVGLGYASSLSGDTAVTCVIGGRVTVRNGGFEIRDGQMVQFYFDFEEDCFYHHNQEVSGKRVFAGQRIDDGTDSSSYDKDKTYNPYNPSAAEKQRKDFQGRQNGTDDAFPIGGPGSVKRNVAYPKPYVPRSDGTDHYGDKIRVFCKCTQGARPWEMVDLMVSDNCLKMFYSIMFSHTSEIDDEY